MYRYSPFFEFPRSFAYSGFCRVNFNYFDTNFCFKSFIQALRDIHHATSCPAVRRVKGSQSVYMKKSCPACQGYPSYRVETTRPPELSRPPRRVCKPNVNGWLILQRNKRKVTSARVTRGKGCLGYPRPYKWGLRPTFVNQIYPKKSLFAIR